MTYTYSVANLEGSEKQKAWAQDIVDGALGTINRNIEMLTQRQAQSESAQHIFDDDIALYNELGANIVNNLLGKGRFATAKGIIENREMLSSSNIAKQVQAERNRRAGMAAKH